MAPPETVAHCPVWSKIVPIKLNCHDQADGYLLLYILVITLTSTRSWCGLNFYEELKYMFEVGISAQSSYLLFKIRFSLRVDSHGKLWFAKMDLDCRSQQKF